MKFSLWTQYGALNSAPVFDAFRTSVIAAGHTAADNATDGDVDVIWSVLWNGRMAQNQLVWRNAENINKPVIVLMHGSGLTHIVWSLHEQFLTTAGFSVLSLDLPGHGNSEGKCLLSIKTISLGNRIE